MVSDGNPSPAPAESGVYYSRSDCAGFSRRLFILLVDLAVVTGAWMLATWLWEGSTPESDQDHLLYLAAWGAFVFAYLVVAESYGHTLGFWLAGVRIVTLGGERPSLLRMTFRLLIWVLGPIHPAFDIFWLGGDPQRQTLRDKFACTLVVRRNAVPAGRGVFRFNRHLFLNLNLGFFEVDQPLEKAPK